MCLLTQIHFQKKKYWGICLEFYTEKKNYKIDGAFNPDGQIHSN